MSDGTEDEVRTFWNEEAEGWRVQVGEDGDVNRRFNSDPLVWALLGRVAGRRVLDVGCGTGYLTKKLSERGRVLAPFPYFQRRRCVDPPWGHFEREFTWFHRPLSDYWRAFTEAGFSVERFEEPRIADDLLGSVESDRVRRKLATRPYSVAFRLRKSS